MNNAISVIVKICPSCNYSETSEAGFPVCPRCGLIIAKYLHRKNLHTPEIDIIRSPTIGVETSCSIRNLKIFAFVALGILVLFITTAVINKYMKTRSGTIIWSKEYFPNSSSATPGFVHGMAIESDFIYLVGSYGRSDTHTGQWSIQKRKTSDGTLVQGFGEGGFVKSAFGPREDYANGVVLDSRYIYIIGMDRTPWGDDKIGRFDSQWRIEKRRLSDGLLVEEFGEGGVVTSNLTPYFERPEEIAIDADYMYVAGTEGFQGDHYQWRVEKRWLSDGSLVPDFGIEGVLRSNSNDSSGFAGSKLVNAMAMGIGSMYVMGQAYNSTSIDTCWRIEKRRLGDGFLARDFGRDGFVTGIPHLNSNEKFGIAIDDKSMFIAGFEASTGNPLNTHWRIEKRSLSDGAFVREFGKGGVATNNNPLGRANGIVLEQEPGFWKKIMNLDLSSHQSCMYIVGVEKNEQTGLRQWRIEKRKMNNGALCPEFGENGIVSIDPGVEPRVARLIAADTDHIYVSGFKIGSNTSSIIKIKK